MTTQLIAKKVGDAYDIYAVRNGEKVKVGSIVHGLKAVLSYRGSRHYVNFYLHHKVADVLSSIRFFVDQADTMERIEEFQKKVRQTA